MRMDLFVRPSETCCIMMAAGSSLYLPSWVGDNPFTYSLAILGLSIVTTTVALNSFVENVQAAPANATQTTTLARIHHFRLSTICIRSWGVSA